MIRIRSIRLSHSRTFIPHLSSLSCVKIRNFSRCLKLQTESSSSSHIQIEKKKQDYDSSKQYSPSQCTSCGINLQSKDPKEQGYYIEPKKTNAARNNRSKSLQFVSALSKLDNNGRELLGMSTDIYTNEILNIEKKQENLICKRCHDALYHSQFDFKENIPLKYQQVIDSIPKNSNILQIFSAYDFPLSLVRVKSRNNVTYVMNKTDLLFGHDSTSFKYKDYFNIMVERLTGSTNRPMIISAYTNWGIFELFKRLEPLNHLVGFVNAGKTRLCNRLLNFGNQLKTPGSKIIKSQGSSYIPALTRDNIVHECLDKTVVDVPGFLEEDGVFKHLKQTELKSVLEGKKVLVSDLKDTKYFTLKNQNCLTFGGIFFLIPPKDTILQIKSIIPCDHYIFKDLSKGIEVVKSPPEALTKYIKVKQEAMDDLVRYVIPPFHGTIDLVVKDVGYIQIKPTGGKKNDDLFEIWAPRGVILGVRETIEHFLTRYMKQIKIKEKKSRTKQRTIKIEKVERLKMEPKKVPDYKIFSSLYEIPQDCKDPVQEMVVQYDQHIKEHKNSYHRWRPSDYRDDTRNKYWIEKL